MALFLDMTIAFKILVHDSTRSIIYAIIHHARQLLTQLLLQSMVQKQPVVVECHISITTRLYEVGASKGKFSVNNKSRAVK